jgi:5-methylcytosine-specific restriction endonuclease McrA
MDEGTKKCTKCKKEKPKTFIFFRYRKESRDKLRSSCIDCDKESARKYRDSNSLKIKEIAKHSRKKNYEKISSRMKEWNLKNKEWRKRWESKNKQKRIEYVKTYKENMPYEKKQEQLLKARIRSREWRKKNPDCQSEYHKKYACRNKPKLLVIARNYKARKKNAEGYHTKEEIEEIIKKQKGLCFWCSVKLSKIHIDHYIPLKKGGSNYSSNLVASCPKCNHSKGAKMPWEFKAQELFPSIKVTHAIADALLIAKYGTQQ